MNVLQPQVAHPVTLNMLILVLQNALLVLLLKMDSAQDSVEPAPTITITDVILLAQLCIELLMLVSNSALQTISSKEKYALLLQLIVLLINSMIH